MKEQLNQIAMKSMLQTQASTFAGGNLFFAPGANYGQQQQGFRNNNMFNPGTIMQLAAQPPQQFGFNQMPMQPQMPPQMPPQQQYNSGPGKVQIFPQPQQQQQPMPNPVFIPQQQQQRPMQPQFQPQFQPQPLNFGFGVPQMGFGAQIPQYGFGNQDMGFGMPQFGNLGGHGFGSFGFNMF
mgnify:FL=1|jgi:hypothetical protein